MDYEANKKCKNIIKFSRIRFAASKEAKEDGSAAMISIYLFCCS